MSSMVIRAFKERLATFSETVFSMDCKEFEVIVRIKGFAKVQLTKQNS